MLSQPASVRIKHKFLYIKDLCDLGVLCGDESGLTTCRRIGGILSLPHIGLRQVLKLGVGLRRSGPLDGVVMFHCSVKRNNSQCLLLRLVLKCRSEPCWIASVVPWNLEHQVEFDDVMLFQVDQVVDIACCNL